MKSLSDYITELKIEHRNLRRQYCLQTASNTLSPDDLTRLYNLLPEIGGQELCKLAPYYNFMVSKKRQKQLGHDPLVAHDAKYGALCYTNTSEPIENQRIFILFSGGEGQFFIPLSMMLSLLPPGNKTVLVFGSGNERLFRFGVDGLGKSPFDVADALRTLFKADQFLHISVLGLSAGGFFALRVAELLNADIGLSFAGVFIDNFRPLTQLHAAKIHAFDSICQCKKQPRTRLINVLSTKNEFDCRASILLQKMRPRLINCHLVYGEHHNVLNRMTRKGYVRFFMYIALTRNPIFIRLVALPFFVFGHLIRSIRQLVGLQKDQAWYRDSQRR